MASQISVNFAVSTNDAHFVDAGETSLTGIPGTVALDGSVWNNIELGSGTPTTFTSATQSGSHIDLLDSAGIDSGVDMTSSGAFFANVSGVSSPNQTSTGDAGLMDSYILANNTETISLSGLSAWATNGYRVYATFDIGIVTRTYGITIHDGSINQTFWISDSTALDSDANNDGVMEWRQTSAETVGSAESDANYAVYGLFTGDTLTISGGSSARAALNGFQIVRLTGPPATITSFSAEPGMISTGETVTLSWEVTDADSVSIDHGVGTVASTGTVQVTPTNSTTWTLTATREASVVTKQTSILVSKGSVDVYLLGGQSNMQGLGLVAELTAEQGLPPTNVFYWNGSNFEALIPGTTTTSTAGAFGPEIAFATAIAKTNRNTYLIKYYSSGKPLDSGWNDQSWIGDPPGLNRVNFYPGTSSSDPNQGTLYRDNMLPRFKSGIADIVSQEYRPIIRGFIWMQGEQDSKAELSAGRYAANLKRLRERLAEDLDLSDATDLPITFGQVLPYTPPEARFVYRDLVRAQQASADMDSGSSNAMLRCRMVSTDGYSLLVDHVHYDTAGQLQLGSTFATAIQEAASIAPPHLQISWGNDPAAAGLSWDGRYGKIYSLQLSTNLVEGTWSNLYREIDGANSELNRSDMSNREKTFYRVVVE